MCDWYRPLPFTNCVRPRRRGPLDRIEGGARIDQGGARRFLMSVSLPLLAVWHGQKSIAELQVLTFRLGTRLAAMIDERVLTIAHRLARPKVNSGYTGHDFPGFVAVEMRPDGFENATANEVPEGLWDAGSIRSSAHYRSIQAMPLPDQPERGVRRVRSGLYASGCVATPCGGFCQPDAGRSQRTAMSAPPTYLTGSRGPKVKRQFSLPVHDTMQDAVPNRPVRESGGRGSSCNFMRDGAHVCRPERSEGPAFAFAGARQAGPSLRSGRQLSALVSPCATQLRSRASHACAKRKSRITVGAEVPSTCAASSSVRPAK